MGRPESVNNSPKPHRAAFCVKALDDSRPIQYSRHRPRSRQRTPIARVNSSDGRDHWPWAYSLALAGGGIAGGLCLGATDAIAAYPTRDPHDPSDLAATVYHLLGIPPDTIIHDQLRRPYELIQGRKIDALIA